jgi:EmrB/QacA subfamily drug resistance transporter
MTAAADKLDAALWKVVAVVIVGSLLAQLDATIVNVSLSNLAQELHTTLSTIQWVTSAYLLALTFVLPINGWLVDRIGARALYLRCFALFTASSVLCALAWSAPSLIGFRILQGISGGLLAPMAQMTIKRAAGIHFTRVAGYAALPVLLGPLLGPVLAGAILHGLSWRWLFLVNLPVGLLGWLLALRWLPDDLGERRPRALDWLGLLLLSPGLALLLVGAEHVSDARVDPAAGWAIAGGAVLLVLFWLVQKRKGERALIDLGQFRMRVFSVAAAAQFLTNGVSFAGQLLIPLFLIEACGQSAAAMGWLLAPLGLGMMVSYPSLGALVGRFGARAVALGGALLALIGTLALVWQAGHPLALWLLLPALFLRGMGQGAVGLSAISAAYAQVEPRDLAMATTTLNIVQRLGGPTLTTLCAVALGALLAGRVQTFGLDAWGCAFVLLSFLHALCTLAAAGLPGHASRI